MIQHLTTQHPKVELIKNIIRSILKMKSLYPSQFLAPYHREIDAITTVDEAFQFMIDNNFVGYLNFQLLEYFSSETFCGEAGSKKVQDKLTEYKKCYIKFLEEPSFGEVIQVFDENPHLNPSKIIGLPIIVVRLSMEWKKRKTKDLEEWLPFLKENKVTLQSMGYSCILITYAVFPIDLLSIMDFLNDRNNIKTLKDNGISIETPSHTLEIAKLLREDIEDYKTKQKGTTLPLTDYILLQQLSQEVSSLKKQVKQSEEQRKADNSYWITQVTLLKASHLVDSEKFTELFKTQEEQNQAAQSYNIQKINELTNELDKVTSTVQMLERESKRHTPAQKLPNQMEKVKMDRKSSSPLPSQIDTFSQNILKKRTYSTDSGFDTTDRRASMISTYSMEQHDP